MWPIYWPAGQGGCQIQHVRPNSGYASLHSEGHKQKQNRTSTVWLQCEENTHGEDISQRRKSWLLRPSDADANEHLRPSVRSADVKPRRMSEVTRACSDDSRIILHKHEELNTFPHREKIYFHKKQPEKIPHLEIKYGAWKTRWEWKSLIKLWI